MGKNAGDIITAPGEPAIQVFTANGTWNKPNGVRAVRVRVVGGGGGSGGCSWASGQGNSAGGHGGGYAEAYILAVNLLATEPVTVGTGGLAGPSGNNSGTTGGTSSFGAHCSATGGGPGVGMAATTGNSLVQGNSPGVGSGGDINLSGSAGGFGQVVSGLALRGAFGGASLLGGSTRQSTAAGGAAAGLSYGAGGAGVYVTAAAAAGSPGAGGVVIVESIF